MPVDPSTSPGPTRGMRPVAEDRAPLPPDPQVVSARSPARCEATPMHTIRPLETSDWADWSALWGGYLVFYRAELSEETSRATFERLCAGTEGLFGLLALDEDRSAIGLANCVVHATTWSRRPKCYLEDLFVSPASRGGDLGPGPAQGGEAGGHRPGRTRRLLAHPAVQRPGPFPLRRRGAPHLLRRLRDVAPSPGTPERSLLQRTFTVFSMQSARQLRTESKATTPTVRTPHGAVTGARRISR